MNAIKEELILCRLYFLIILQKGHNMGTEEMFQSCNLPTNLYLITNNQTLIVIIKYYLGCSELLFFT